MVLGKRIAVTVKTGMTISEFRSHAQPEKTVDISRRLTNQRRNHADEMWVVLLIGRAAWEICLRGHFAGKPVVASRKVSCFLRLSCAELKHLHFGRPRYKCLEKQP